MYVHDTPTGTDVASVYSRVILVTVGANVMNYGGAGAVETSTRPSFSALSSKETAPAASVFLDTESLVTNITSVTGTKSLKIFKTTVISTIGEAAVHLTFGLVLSMPDVRL